MAAPGDLLAVSQALTSVGDRVVLGLAGLVVGVLVGLTGAGGSSVLTPLLILIFGLAASSAVGTDLVASLVMKPVGGLVHLHHKTVRMDIVRWLSLGSVPGAVLGVGIVSLSGASANSFLLPLLGVALLATALAMLLRPRLRALAERRASELTSREWAQEGGGTVTISQKTVTASKTKVRRTATLLVGLLGGTVVGLTSVGSGSLMVVGLTMVYPELTMAELVGTDLVQAIPMVGAAALGHLFLGGIHFGVAGVLLIGAIPGTFLGARLSSRSDGRLARGALIAVLAATGAKLVGVL